jgi:tyrosine-specific transport protein
MTDTTHKIKGALLIAGTTIGGGVLGLPVVTGIAGFFPSLLIYLLCWVFMATTGLLFLEISLWMGKDANIITMAEKTLGLPGKIAAWALYLFLFYCLTLAYIVGSGDLFVQAFSGVATLKPWQGQLLFLALFGPFVYAGAKVVGHFNVFLMIGLGVSYLGFIFLGAPHVDTTLLLRSDWSYLWLGLPITFTSFAYQGTIPTLVAYLERDVKAIRWAILIGSFIPFVAYVIWQALILGIVPVEGAGGLKATLEAGQNAIYPLRNALNTSTVYVVGQYFAFFALITSFFGVTLGLLDFLADGLNVKKDPMGKLFLCGLIFVPPCLFALVHPHVFLMALEYAGGYGTSLLLGLLPVLMVWRGRYHLNMKGSYEVRGGRLLLLLLIAFVAIEVASQVAVSLQS